MKLYTLSELSLEDLLPHRDNMLLVDQVLAVDSTRAKTLARVNRKWPFAQDEGVDPLILIELAAQTAGVCNGWDRIHTQGLDSNQMGWLVGIKKAEIDVGPLPYDAPIISTAENTHVFENLRETACEVFMDDVRVATIILQLFQA
ncbi:hypothetical protein [Desulfogranum japonicum]|uniref:hypothetical protein n=1 Tax=Desulfogranum japonicum TaxID=231447 RepID=UPI0004174BE8|nr:hypothetical protein [Desulfogranum japonicum]